MLKLRSTLAAGLAVGAHTTKRLVPPVGFLGRGAHLARWACRSSEGEFSPLPTGTPDSEPGTVLLDFPVEKGGTLEGKQRPSSLISPDTNQLRTLFLSTPNACTSMKWLPE